MKTFHIGGMNPMRRYKTLEAALAQVNDDDAIELHKNITFSGVIKHNIILNGNGHTMTIENGTVGLDCQQPIVIRDLNFISEPRSNAIILQNGGRLEKVTTKIKGPARVLYPTIIHKKKTLSLTDCDLMRIITEGDTITKAVNCSFHDYYGGIYHISGGENLSIFRGNFYGEGCDCNCCNFEGETVLRNSLLGVFNHSSNKLDLIDCRMEPKLNQPTVNLSKEPSDGPLEQKNDQTHFSLEHEKGCVRAINFHSNIPETFVGFHILSGSLEMEQTNNEDDTGYHIVRKASASFTDVRDTAFYDIDGGTLSLVRSEIATSMKTKTAMERLQELIGLDTVKTAITSIMNTISMNQKTGNKDFGFSYHMIFAGDPGTGKTTVAKIVAQALFEIGAIPENKCTEVSVDRLVKGYVGQTAEHVRTVLDEALGGVLFIDEAYELTVKENQNSFNSEVLSVLIRYMEEHRDNLVVIAAGYEKEMREFLASNVGLTRRFQWISFKDYNPQELSAIFESMKNSYEEDYEDERLAALLPQLFENLTRLYLRKPDVNGRTTNGGNGGLVRNVFQRVITARNDRVAGHPEASILIEKADLMSGFRSEMEKAINTGA